MEELDLERKERWKGRRDRERKGRREGTKIIISEFKHLKICMQELETLKFR